VTIAIDRAPGELRAAALDAAGRLVDVALERPGGPTDVGDLHRGRVVARVPALAGAFVRLDGAEGFLPDSAGGRDATEGAVLAVRVVRAAQGGKGPRLEAVDAPAGAGPPARLAAGPGALARLAALHAGATPREGWDAAVAEQVAALAEPEVALPRGGRMSITPTPALVAIDIDLGAGASGRGGRAREHAEANTAWLPELARQIRLRDLGGAILVDFAGLSARRRGALGEGLARALAGDPRRPRLLGFTALGLAEILRPRGHAPWHERMAGPHAAALAAARALARAAAGGPARRFGARVAPALLAAFDADAVLRDDLRRGLGEPARIVADPALTGHRWELFQV
jgi:Ribonuclease G/E